MQYLPYVKNRNRRRYVYEECARACMHSKLKRLNRIVKKEIEIEREREREKKKKKRNNGGN
jgi:uncharacterized protein YutD